MVCDWRELVAQVVLILDLKTRVLTCTAVQTRQTSLDDVNLTLALKSLCSFSDRLQEKRTSDAIGLALNCPHHGFSSGHLSRRVATDGRAIRALQAGGHDLNFKSVETDATALSKTQRITEIYLDDCCDVCGFRRKYVGA